MKKLNCWEFKKCGREPRGARAQELGVCPAAQVMELDNVHGGMNGGRSCWVIAGTYCKGEVQGSFAQKYHNCSQCDFYKAVKAEEGLGFTLSAVLLDRVQSLKKTG